VVRQGGIYHEILEEAVSIKADLILMNLSPPGDATYFLAPAATWCATQMLGAGGKALRHA